MVAHGGTSVAGSFIQTLTMVDTGERDRHVNHWLTINCYVSGVPPFLARRPPFPPGLPFLQSKGRPKAALLTNKLDIQAVALL